MTSRRSSVSGNLDLNLLVPLIALLEHRSVTRAAQSLQIGQPAMSATLARLRRLYADELLVRVGQHYELTPLAQSLIEPAGAVLEQAAMVLSPAPEPDPGTLRRAFRLGLTEYEMAVLAGPLLARVGAVAPEVSVHFDLTRSEHMSDFAGRLRHLDCMVVQAGWLSGYPRVELFTDTLCVAVSEDNTTAPEPAGPADLAGMRWSMLTDSPLLLAIMGRMVDAPIPPARIVSTSDSYVGQLFSITGTDLACPMPQRLLEPLAAACGVRVLRTSGPAEKLVSHLVWHPARERDRGLAWFRRQVQDAARDAGG